VALMCLLLGIGLLVGQGFLYPLEPTTPAPMGLEHLSALARPTGILGVLLFILSLLAALFGTIPVLAKVSLRVFDKSSRDR
jgi:hypothetical protein